MNRHEIKHPVCRDEGCDVELIAGRIYCEAHGWLIERWLDRSKKMLQAIKAQDENKKAA